MHQCVCVESANFGGWVWSKHICPSLILCTCVRLSTAIPSAPSAPRMLTVTATPSGSTVELNWLPPLYPNGDIRYEIEYDPAMSSGDPVNAGSSSTLYFTLTLPNEFLTYNVRVVAVSTQGSRSGESNTVSVCPGRNRGAWYMHKGVRKIGPLPT